MLCYCSLGLGCPDCVEAVYSEVAVVGGQLPGKAVPLEDCKCGKLEILFFCKPVERGLSGKGEESVTG